MPEEYGTLSRSRERVTHHQAGRVRGDIRLPAALLLAGALLLTLALGPSPASVAAQAPPPATTWTPPTLTLDSIFKTPPDFRGANPAEVRVLVATGDIIPARSVNATVLALGDFLYPYRPTIDYLKSGDLLFVNLEAPLTASCATTTEGMTFCGDARHGQGLVYAGVSVAGLANNHLGNYGQAGTSETIQLSHRQLHRPGGPRHVGGKSGAGNQARLPGVQRGGRADRSRPGSARDRGGASEADVVVVQFHWGQEYTSFPQRAPRVAPDDPRDVAHDTIDAGADLIIGNHPHWVQGVELYHGGFIAYAHGNFIFDQMWSRETREGVVGRYTFYGKRLIAVEYKPVLIENYAQPRFVEGADASRILNRMEEASRRLAGG